ncbi:TolC family protein [Flavihumibacter petaseus]|uniref:TolC family protein n=1 Tax=Flavihumibacter petaseus TaxID=549295 RepID=UPI000AC8B9BF|nr:TolC family protein [Flavihumibacter petaseus]
MRRKLLTIAVCLTVFLHTASAQAQRDTLRLSIPEAEKIFLQHNLQLLAAQYNIDANKALIQQAKLWDNPILVTDQNIYDGEFFRHNSEYGQVFVQVQQLIKTAGKRSKLAQLATDNTAIATAQFDDVLRSLRFTLRNDMIEAAHLGNISKLFQDEIAEVGKLVEGMDQVYHLGNISLKDNMRLKALLFSLQNDLINIRSQLIPVQAEIRLLLQTQDSSYIQPQLSTNYSQLINAGIPALDSLVADALRNRPDERIAALNKDLQVHNLSYQKALAKPDLTVGPEYDQRNSYVPNYVGLTVSLPLNLFNRNQGNIRAAQSNIQVSQTQLLQENDRISNEVKATMDKFRFMQTVNNKDQAAFTAQYDTLFQNMLKSYQARQINLLDFTDFLDAYKETRIKLTEQQINLMKAADELNFVTNDNILPIQ